MLHTFFCLVLVCIMLDTIVGYGILGDANMYFQYVDDCEEPVQLIQFDISQKKFNRTTHVLDLIFNTPFGLGDYLTAEFKGSIKMQGGYKPGSLYMKGPACQMLYLVMGEIFIELLEQVGVKNCPLPPENYTIRNFYFDNEKYKVPQVYGEYKTELLIFKEEKMLMCYYVYYELVPKPE